MSRHLLQRRLGLHVAIVCLSLAALLGTGAVASAGPLVRVSQESAPGAGDFDANILGFITPFSTGGTAVQFYGYNTTRSVSYSNNISAFAINRSHLFLVNGSDGLSLFVVHDRPLHGTGGNNGGGTANTRYDLVNDTASILVRDDPGDGYPLTGPNVFTASHNWVNPNTDGLVIGSLDGNFTMFAQFTATPTGLNSWQALSDGSSAIPLDLVTGRRVRLDFAPEVAEVPEPGTLALVGLGCAFVIGARRRRQAKS